MSFTKVAPAGIGTEPGSAIRIGDSLLHSTGIDIGTGSGIGVTIRQHGDGTIAVRFYRNGSEFTGTEGGHIYSYAQNSGWHGLCGQIITNMSVNDYMEVFTAANNMKVDGNNYGQFGGYMIG